MAALRTNDLSHLALQQLVHHAEPDADASARAARDAHELPSATCTLGGSASSPALLPSLHFRSCATGTVFTAVSPVSNRLVGLVTLPAGADDAGGPPNTQVLRRPAHPRVRRGHTV